MNTLQASAWLLRLHSDVIICPLVMKSPQQLVPEWLYPRLMLHLKLGHTFWCLKIFKILTHVAGFRFKVFLGWLLAHSVRQMGKNRGQSYWTCIWLHRCHQTDSRTNNNTPINALSCVLWSFTLWRGFSLASLSCVVCITGCCNWRYVSVPFKTIKPGSLNRACCGQHGRFCSYSLNHHSQK